MLTGVRLSVPRAMTPRSLDCSRGIARPRSAAGILLIQRRTRAVTVVIPGEDHEARRFVDCTLVSILIRCIPSKQQYHALMLTFDLTPPTAEQRTSITATLTPD